MVSNIGKRLLSNIQTAKLQMICVCVEVLWPSQPIGVMPSMVSFSNNTVTGQA